MRHVADRRIPQIFSPKIFQKFRPASTFSADAFHSLFFLLLLLSLFFSFRFFSFIFSGKVFGSNLWVGDGGYVYLEIRKRGVRREREKCGGRNLKSRKKVAEGWWNFCRV